MVPYRIPPHVRGLIFDFDGTLVDSMPTHLISWREAFATFGRTFDADFFYRHAGVSLPGVVRLYNEAHGTALDPDEVASLKDRLHVKFIPQTRPIPGVVEIVRQHHGKIPMAIASGNARANVSAVLAALEMTHFFDAVVCGEDVPCPKPAPDCFLRAASLIGVAPSLCEVFEDAEPGLEAARRAGMRATDVRPWSKGHA